MKYLKLTCGAFIITLVTILHFHNVTKPDIKTAKPHLVERRFQQMSIQNVSYVPIHATENSAETFANTNHCYEDVHEAYRSRLHHLRFQCFSNQNISYQKEFQKLNLYFAEDIKLAFCKVPKSGSTFWLQVFLAITNKSSTNDLFGRKRVDMHVLGESLAQNYIHIKEDYMVFLTSRNPFSRLYSAYVDKLFLPFFATVAHGIVSKSNKTCGSQITFEEFLKFVVNDAKAGNELNMHWNPVHKLCQPCNIPYTVIAKQETYAADVEYILSRSNISQEMQKTLLSNLYNKHLNNSIKQITRVVIVQAKNIVNIKYFCHSFEEFCRRLWESFVVQGYIDMSLVFPTKRFLNLSYSDLNEILSIYLEYANSNVLSYKQKKAQRLHFITQAYRTVSHGTISSITELFDLDFKFFGYSANHPGYDANFQI